LRDGIDLTLIQATQSVRVCSARRLGRHGLRGRSHIFH
jgi:hypothetical protein